jgi:hypothetical protein
VNGDCDPEARSECGACASDPDNRMSATTKLQGEENLEQQAPQNNRNQMCDKCIAGAGDELRP